METTVQKLGNSLWVRVPRSVAEQASLRPGRAVQIEARNGTIVIRASGHPKPKLADLLQRITRHNIHEEVRIGRPVGREMLEVAPCER